MTDSAEYDPYHMPASAVQDPPKSLWLALRKIGPGIILAGTIVGSGELLLTTSLGAKHGFVFLWLILFSCVIKVFVQIELGRYAISSGKPTLGAINELPGRLPIGAHPLVWWWFVMMLTTFFQHGAMTGTVGQSCNLAFPKVSPAIANWIDGGSGVQKSSEAEPDSKPEPKPGPLTMAETLANAVRARPEYPWAFFTCAVAVTLLWSGGYRRIEVVTTALVVAVTLITVSASVALPFTDYPITWDDIKSGLTFTIPASGVATAFAVFGITGVGASELFYYPYWCLEKGYARYTGRSDGSEAWAKRARGWIRVMHLDAWVSMVVFTISTLGFYFMGATVLHRQNLEPQGAEMIETLSRMFIDTFGIWTRIVFLIGAAAVLFKTLYVSCAANARLTADFFSLNGFVQYAKSEQRGRWIHWLSVFYPVLALTLFLCFKEPKFMVVVGGVGQALTLPMISAATIYFRYRKTDRRITPELFLDILLWLAFVSITCVAGYAMWDKVVEWMKPVAG